MAYKDLRAELIGVAKKEVDRCGVGGVDKAAIVNQFLGRGPARSGLYRWLDAYLAGPEPKRRLKTRVKKAERRRAARSAAPAAGAAVAAAEIVAPPLSFARVAASGAVPFVNELASCIATVKEVLAHARYEDGRLKLPKMTLAAVREMRGCLAVGVQWQEQQADQERLEAFHAAVLAAVAEESPACAERILVRLKQVNAAWGG